MKRNAYISKVFGKTRKFADYLRDGAMPEAFSYPRLFSFWKVMVGAFLASIVGCRTATGVSLVSSTV